MSRKPKPVAVEATVRVEFESSASSADDAGIGYVYVNGAGLGMLLRVGDEWAIRADGFDAEGRIRLEDGRYATPTEAALTLALRFCRILGGQS